MDQHWTRRRVGDRRPAWSKASDPRTSRCIIWRLRLRHGYAPPRHNITPDPPQRTASASACADKHTLAHLQIIPGNQRTRRPEAPRIEDQSSSCRGPGELFSCQHKYLHSRMWTVYSKWFQWAGTHRWFQPRPINAFLIVNLGMIFSKKFESKLRLWWFGPN